MNVIGAGEVNDNDDGCIVCVCVHVCEKMCIASGVSMSTEREREEWRFEKRNVFVNNTDCENAL